MRKFKVGDKVEVMWQTVTSSMHLNKGDVGKTN